MKKHNFFYRVCLSLSMALSLFHPTLQVSATISTAKEIAILSDSDISQKTDVVLENGINIRINNNNLFNKMFLGLSCRIHADENYKTDNLPLFNYVQHALFAGGTIEKLKNVGITTDSFKMRDFKNTNFITQNYTFTIDYKESENIPKIVKIINLLILHPKYENEAVESARNEFINELKNRDVDINDAKNDKYLTKLNSITPEELREYHSKWYIPENISIYVGCSTNPNEMAQIISDAFESPIQSISDRIVPARMRLRDKNDLNKNETGIKTQLPSDNINLLQTKDILVDGKIWMKQATGLNNWSNGFRTGLGLVGIAAVGGIGACCSAINPLLPVLIGAGAFSASGSYFLFSSYPNDPQYVEKLRKEDLKKGLKFAYNNNRAGMTLTPRERRVFFLNEMLGRALTSPKNPILAISESYSLNDPVIVEMFTKDEHNLIRTLNQEFQTVRNEASALERKLNDELNSLTSKYAKARDESLNNTKRAHKNNYFVVMKENLLIKKEIEIKSIETEFKQNKISIDERNAKIERINNDYKEFLSEPSLRAGIESEDKYLEKIYQEIRAIYSAQIEEVKNSIEYDSHLEKINKISNDNLYSYNKQLNDLLLTFPEDLSEIPDFVDLRS